MRGERVQSLGHHAIRGTPRASVAWRSARISISAWVVHELRWHEVGKYQYHGRHALHRTWRVDRKAWPPVNAATPVRLRAYCGIVKRAAHNVLRMHHVDDPFHGSFNHERYVAGEAQQPCMHIRIICGRSQSACLLNHPSIRTATAPLR